jgi:hypothetical protein
VEPAPEIDRVEWLSSSPEAVIVRVHGHGAPPRDGDAVKLIVDDAGQPRAFTPEIGISVNENTGEWTAAFSVPIELRPALEANLALEADGIVLALPGALAGGEVGAPSVHAQVIDRGVLAERRARRAELAEQALLRRATEAEATVQTLQRQLTNLEQRFSRTNEELDRVRPQLTQADAERRRLRQREYAEQQQRLEAEERTRRLEAQIAGESDGLRAELRRAEREAERIGAELERVQRALAEAQHAAVADRAELRRARDELAARGGPADDPGRRVFVRVDSTEERVQALGDQLRSISDHLARREVALEAAVAAELQARDALAAEHARHDEELAGLQRRVEALRGDLHAAIGLMRTELLAERQARMRAEADLENEREAVRRLDAELEQARTAAAGTALAPTDLPRRSEATDSEIELRREREEMAEALAAAVARLRSRAADVAGEPPGAATEPPPVLTAAQAGGAAVSAAAATPPPAPAEGPDREGAPLPPEDAVELPARLQGVRPRATDWLSRALQRAAVQRDTQLVGELIAELLPAQGLVVRRATTYGVTIDEVGCYRVATTGQAPATVARVDADVLRSLDFEVRGSAGNVGRFVAGRGSWRLHGLRVTPGRRRKARRVARARRVPLTLAELATANIRVWPGLLLPVLAEAVDPAWTAGHDYLVGMAVTGATPTMLYVGVHDGAAVTVSPRRLDAAPVATLFMSEQACLNLLARTPLPAGERVLCSGDLTAAERLLDWLDRAQLAAG